MPYFFSKTSLSADLSEGSRYFCWQRTSAISFDKQRSDI